LIPPNPHLSLLEAGTCPMAWVNCTGELSACSRSHFVRKGCPWSCLQLKIATCVQLAQGSLHH